MQVLHIGDIWKAKYFKGQDLFWSFLILFQMKQRDLERAEIAKAALQTDEVEVKLTKIKQEYVAYKGQSQDQLKELQAALLKAEEELKELRVELGNYEYYFQSVSFWHLKLRFCICRWRKEKNWRLTIQNWRGWGYA